MKLLRQMQRTKQLTVLLICGLALSGCGNYLGDVTVEGRSGLARSEAGDVIIRVQRVIALRFLFYMMINVIH